MITILSTLVSALSFRFRSRASLELELLAIRHQVSVLRRQHKGRLRLFSTDRLLWVWLYRIWPRCLDAMVLVKPATVIQWHRAPPDLRQIDGVTLQIREFAILQRGFVGRAKHHARRLAGFERFLPARRAETPAVAGLKSRKAEFRHRR